MADNDNLRAAALMTFAMAFFAVADASIKVASDAISTGMILIALGGGGGLFFAAIARLNGVPLASRAVLHPAVIGRCLVEIAATTGIVLAVSYADLSTVSAIMQAAPLVVMAGAALLFGERIGWRRILALCLGVLGVMLILRPSASGFEPGLIFAVVAALGFGARDLLTRAVPRDIPSIQIAAAGAFSLVPAGVVLIPITGWDVRWEAQATLPVIIAVMTSALAYYAITAVMRIGEISAVAPFRYTRLIFAAGIGIVWFGERPDALAWFGAALIVGSGLFALSRGRKEAAARA